jgi:hypothetical protein
MSDVASAKAEGRKFPWKVWLAGIVFVIVIAFGLKQCDGPSDEAEKSKPLVAATQAPAPAAPSSRGLLGGVHDALVGTPGAWNSSSSIPDAVPNQPPETLPDSSAPVAGVVSKEAPSVTDLANPDADVNWNAWTRGHPGYSIYYLPDFPNPSFRVECWDLITNKPVLDEGTACAHSSATREQSTSAASITIQYGFMYAAR